VEPDDEPKDDGLGDFYTQGLAQDCGYDPIEDCPIDALIDYKDACEGTLDRIEILIRDTEGLTLTEWLNAKERA
jgi:hypothetical protein